MQQSKRRNCAHRRPSARPARLPSASMRLSGEREGYALRVLLLGVGPAAFEALRFAARQRARLTIFDPDARRLERVRLNHGGASDVSFCADLNALADAGFDLVLSAGGLSRLAGEGDTLSRLAAKCAEGALMVAVEPTPSLFLRSRLKPDGGPGRAPGASRSGEMGVRMHALRSSRRRRANSSIRVPTALS